MTAFRSETRTSGARLLVQLTGLASVLFLTATLQAIERRPLPEFAISALDGTEAASSSLVRDGQWLLLYLEMGCSACDSLMRAVVEERTDFASHLVIVVGGVDAATAAKLPGAFPRLSAARWYADPTKAFSTVLRTPGAPVVYGLRGNMLEWSLTGVVPDAAAYKTTLVSWVTAR
jgi:hypothetical protein